MYIAYVNLAFYMQRYHCFGSCCHRSGPWTIFVCVRDCSWSCCKIFFECFCYLVLTNTIVREYLRTKNSSGEKLKWLMSLDLKKKKSYEFHWKFKCLMNRNENICQMISLIGIRYTVYQSEPSLEFPGAWGNSSTDIFSSDKNTQSMNSMVLFMNIAKNTSTEWNLHNLKWKWNVFVLSIVPSEVHELSVSVFFFRVSRRRNKINT